MPSLLPPSVVSREPHVWRAPSSSLGARLRRVGSHPATAPVLVGLGLLISLFRIDGPSVWYDESATIISSTRSWSQLWDMIGTVDAVHALYYALMHVVFDVFGYSPLTLRAPSALAVGATAALTMLLGRSLNRTSFGVLAGVVFCLLPRTTWVGTEGRSYALTTTFAALLTLLLIRAIRSRTRGPWILYAVTIVVACVLFLYTALIVVAHAVTVLVWHLIERRAQGRASRDRTSSRTEDTVSGADRASAGADPDRAPVRPFLVRWVLWAGVATVVIVPFALATMDQSQQLHWLDPLGKKTVWHVLVGQWFYTSNAFAYVGWTLVIIGALSLLRTPAVGAVLVPALVVPTLALLVVTVVYLPLYTPRYLTMCLPFVALMMAAGIWELAGRSARGVRAWGIFSIAAAVLISFAVPQILAQRLPEAKEDSAWKAVAAHIAEEREQDDPDTPSAILYGGIWGHPIATARVIAYSYPEAFTNTVDITLDTPAAETGHLWETTTPLSTNLDRIEDTEVIYLVASFSRDIRAESTQVLAQAGWRIDTAWDFTHVHVIRYVRD
jgi:mannosyltransferase